MAFGTNGRTTGSLAEINVTPLVDVILVLLIIFMVTAPLIESGIEVDLPQTRMVKTITEERVTITIDRRETLYVGSDKVNVNDLAAHLRKLMRDPERQEVFLRADKDVRFGTVAQVIDRLRVNGITKVNVVTKPYVTENK